MNTPNLAKMREQLEAIKNPKKSSSKEDSVFWKLEEGDHQLRLLALPDGQIMREFHWHYGVNGKNHLCAKRSFGKDCPICDLASNIWQEYDAGRSDGKPDEDLKEMAKDLFASKRFYFAVLVRGLEEEGAKVYSAGTRAAEQIFTIALDPENSDMFDAKKGFDLKIKYALSNPQDRRTAATTINAARTSSPVIEGASKDELEQLFASIPDFDSLFEIPDPDEIRTELDTFISGMAGSVSDSLGVTQYAAETTSVRDAFAQIRDND